MTLIRPTKQNLASANATGPLTAWLIHAAKSHRTMTYGQAKQRLECDCGFGVIFPPMMGVVAGAAMNAILEQDPDAPLLNVLLVQSQSGLPGKGAAGYLASRHPNDRWLQRDNAHEHPRWRELVEHEAARVYKCSRWSEIYRLVCGRELPDACESPAGVVTEGGVRRGGEGVNHKMLRLKVTREPSLVRPGLRPENTQTEVELLSGDRVDVVSVARDRTIAIEVKSRDSNFSDLRRGLYQCVKYRAVIAAQDLRRNPAVETWLVTEEALPNELLNLARRLDVRTKEILHIQG